MRVLVANAGSSSVKLRVLGHDDELERSTDLSATGGRFEASELREALAGVGEVDGVGHRVVHGGTRFTEPVLVDANVETALEELVELAPLHQPFGLAALRAVGEVLPDVPAVACFDTAFHATIPSAAATYAVPVEWRARWPVRRFGFHGLSHRYASRRAAELCGRAVDDESFRVVTCHLGAGASLAAVRGGRSVDTTMGFTPLEGLVMATRSGTVDPGLVLWLVEQGGLAAADVRDGLDHHGGLLALAGTSDMHEVLTRDDGDARLALDVYVHALCRGIGAMLASLGGLDALVFTGGVGEHAAPVRDAAIERLAFLGVGAAVPVHVVEAREDLEIARGVRSVLGADR